MDGAATGATYELIEILILSEIISRIQNIDRQPENQLSENQNLAKMLCANYWETRFLLKKWLKHNRTGIYGTALPFTKAASSEIKYLTNENISSGSANRLSVLRFC